ncbi:hypothetical protein PHPALM_31235 [Phytophthora palmivora]|uniref:Uncharacterized protein n=1 Tax=Phytophthora palmivora TaxID=4796 RepID=A0A2P4X342_9STRA|nr:hypothetical protein PHPALM_31235 [Phytophthora palmivora]
MKVNVYVAAEGGDSSARRICWYMGTSDAQVEKAIRMQLRLPPDMDFLLRDADGDVVPVSSTLPNGQHYTIERDEMQENPLTSTETNESIDRPITSDNSDELSSVITQEQVTSSSSPKRRRLEIEELAGSDAPVSPMMDTVMTVTTSGRRDSAQPRSIATIIAQFVDTFTRPIANHDNVSFIPNVGRFALYELYCELIKDTKFHPKREDVFYKMTSMHGKVDRQRVNRYYQCSADNGQGMKYVLFKPLGKGVLLRRYRKVGTAEELEDVVKTAPFISWLGLESSEVVATYERFVDGFMPIAKGEYRAHSSWVQASDGAIQQALRA